jgi:uncharacterized protein (DUF433 family)
MATVLRQPQPAEITCDPEIMGGWPCIAGTRIPAETILACILAGDDDRRIVRAYPTMPLGGIEAVRQWAHQQGRL